MTLWLWNWIGSSHGSSGRLAERCQRAWHPRAPPSCRGQRRRLCLMLAGELNRLILPLSSSVHLCSGRRGKARVGNGGVGMKCGGDLGPTASKGITGGPSRVPAHRPYVAVHIIGPFSPFTRGPRFGQRAPRPPARGPHFPLSARCGRLRGTQDHLRRDFLPGAARLGKRATSGHVHRDR